MQKFCWLAGSILQKKIPFSKLSHQLDKSLKITLKMSTVASVNKYSDFLKFIELVGSLKVSLLICL